jgi:hypothetical protein
MHKHRGITDAPTNRWGVLKMIFVRFWAAAFAALCLCPVPVAKACPRGEPVPLEMEGDTIQLPPENIEAGLQLGRGYEIIGTETMLTREKE